LIGLLHGAVVGFFCLSFISLSLSLFLFIYLKGRVVPKKIHMTLGEQYEVLANAFPTQFPLLSHKLLQDSSMNTIQVKDSH
jgi:hypothetical protein